MTIRTGASAFVDVQYEDSYNGPTSGNLLHLFGKDQNASGIEFANGQEPVPQLYRSTYESFLYGKNAGSCTVDFTMSNPFFFSSMMNNPSQTESSGVYTQTWSSGTVNRDIRSMKVRFGMESPGGSNDILQTATGVIATSVNIKTALDQPVSVSEALTWGNDTIVDNAELPVIGSDLDFTPYNFVNGELKVTPDGGSEFTVGTLQDVDLTINISSEHLYQVGSANPVDAYRKLFDITGKFNVAYEDATYSEYVRDRKEQTNAVLTFSNGETGDDARTITVTLSGVGIPSTSRSVAPGEPIFEDVDFQAREITVVAVNETAFSPTQ